MKEGLEQHEGEYMINHSFNLACRYTIFCFSFSVWNSAWERCFVFQYTRVAMCACLLEEGKVCASVQNALNTNSRPPFISHSVFAGGPSLRGGDRMSERLQDNFQVFYKPNKQEKNTRIHNFWYVSNNHSAVAAEVHSCTTSGIYLSHHSYQLLFSSDNPMSAGDQDCCCLLVLWEWLCLWDECHHNAVIASGFFSGSSEFLSLGCVNLRIVAEANWYWLCCLYLCLYDYIYFEVLYSSWRLESQKIEGEGLRCVKCNICHVI